MTAENAHMLNAMADLEARMNARHKAVEERYALLQEETLC